MSHSKNFNYFICDKWSGIIEDSLFYYLFILYIYYAGNGKCNKFSLELCILVWLLVYIYFFQFIAGYTKTG